MKYLVFVVAMILSCFLAASLAAQQDPTDQGVPDSVYIQLGQSTAPGGISGVKAELFLFNDVQNVIGASMAFSWDNPNLVLDTAVLSSTALGAFNYANLVYYKNNIDSSNYYRRFQFVGARSEGDGLAASMVPALVATYYFNVIDSMLADTVCIVLEDFNDLLFVDSLAQEYPPIWRGNVCIPVVIPPNEPRTITNPFNGHIYEFVKLRGTISWPEAKLAAESRGGYLVTVTDSIEARIVTELLAYPGDEAWLGGTDEQVEGDWTWVTGEPWDFTNWYPGEPNAAQPDEDYLLTQHLLGGGWVDAAAPQEGYIIEFESANPPFGVVNWRYWSPEDGGNGHWYAVMYGATTWGTADSLASYFIKQGSRGHLATVASAAENQFILEEVLHQYWTDTIPIDPPIPPFPPLEFWMGGYQTNPGDWHWVTGEPFDYENWAFGHPYDTSETLVLAMSPGMSVIPEDPGPGEWVSASPECLFDCYDCCVSILEFDTQFPPTDTLTNLTQWPKAEGGNDHWYGLVPQPLSWSDARDRVKRYQVEGTPGHLATVASEAENSFIAENILPQLSIVPFPIVPNEFWLGASYVGDWHWVTDEPFDYTNWLFGGGNDDTLQALAMLGRDFCGTPPTTHGMWVSRPPNCDFNAQICPWSVVEFGTDSPCEPQTRHVPSVLYPTIQVAIDKACEGDDIVVAPGTYHESLDYRGKDVVVRSSHGPQMTIITNERTINLAVFDDGESRAAVLDGFTLAGGWMAVLCAGSSPTISHCICVEQNVNNWAAISLCGSFGLSEDPGGDPRHIPSVGPASAALINNTIVHSGNGGISNYSSEPPLYWNNIVAFNEYYGIHNHGPVPQPVIGYNDVFGQDDPQGHVWGNYLNIADPGPGAISEDPSFDRSFGLLIGSPCIDAGDPDPRFNDPDGSRNDMGAVFHVKHPHGDVIPTDEWIVVYCPGHFVPFPMGPDDIVTAFDPDGVMCGVARRSFIDGKIGFMPIYRDDPYTDRDEGAEPGDLISFAINGQPVQSTPLVYWTANGDVFEVCEFGGTACLDIPLHSGWNLISWNVAFESVIHLALDEIVGCIDVVYTFDNGPLIFDPELDGFNTLTDVDYRHGYWFRMKCDAVLQVCAEDIPITEWIGLRPGWNLVSYWPEETLLVEDALIVSGVENFELAMGFDNGAQIWMPHMGGLNTLTHMRPEFGYWLKVDDWLPLVWPDFYPNDCTLYVDDVRERGSDLSLSEEIVPSRNWIAVYGDDIKIDGRPLVEGDLIEFSCQEGAVCGRGVINNGLLKLSPVYGRDDATEAAQKYPAENETLAVTVNGERVYPDLRWSENTSRVRLSRFTSDSRGLPDEYVLEQNYPNPFNPGTDIWFNVPVDGMVSISVYNALGQRVKVLTNKDYVAGRYSVPWDGTDESGSRVATGVYFYKLTSGESSLTKKMLLLK